MFVRKNYKELSREQALIVDFVKLDEQGVGLKNVILTNEVWGSLSRNEKETCNSTYIKRAFTIC